MSTITPIQVARQRIEMALDAMNQQAATIFIEAARAQLAPFNLKRHRLFIKVHPGAGLLIKDGQGNSRIWWELRYPDCPVLTAIYEIGGALDALQEEVARKLDGIALN